MAPSLMAVCPGHNVPATTIAVNCLQFLRTARAEKLWYTPSRASSPTSLAYFLSIAVAHCKAPAGAQAVRDGVER
jgi:hypothetical protein